MNRKFEPFPRYEDRKGWEALSGDIKRRCLEEARKLKGKEWQSLPAVFYLDFYRNGNRTRYESRCFQRRRDLFYLTLGECIEGRGEYLDDIINGIWLICEESSWVVPAHINHDRRAAASPSRRPGRIGPAPLRELPDLTRDIYIDLFAAETGSLLSWVYYFLGNAIGALSPLVKRRMELELERRILGPYLARDDFEWMGLDHDRPVNNWNPWINSNVLVCYLVFAGSFKQYTRGAAKTIRSLNRFLHFYAEDGGCDEGPSYFGVAGASVLDFIEELGQVTGVDYLYRSAKIRNMAAYISKVYIGRDYYVNYADAPPSVSVPVDLLERTGRRTGDESLLDMLAHLRKNGYGVSGNGSKLSGGAWNLYRQLANIFYPSPREEKRAFRAPELSWFGGIQVLCARDKADSLEGLFFSAKGGTNGESHNHNDIGNFLLYCDSVPVLVDAGVETYTKSTFNEDRYTLWTMRSCYHNTPTINGADQLPGTEYRAGEPDLESGGGTTRLSLDMAGAYPGEAGIKSYRRSFVFKHGESLSVEDRYRLKELKAPLTLNFLCYQRPGLAEGRVLLSGKVWMEYGPGFKTELEKITLRDEKIRSDWKKDSLYRLRLTKEDTGISGAVILRFIRTRRR
ncbi:MAG: heparinase II/III-family protein [Treponema sp.]|jgi:hypothetical protein|nr:heparinase II/III-family protein [Treponema sp.]